MTNVLTQLYFEWNLVPVKGTITMQEPGTALTLYQGLVMNIARIYRVLSGPGEVVL